MLLLICCYRATFSIFFSIIAPFDEFEISSIWKYYGKWQVLYMIFSKYSNLKFSWVFSRLSKNRKWCHDLKIAYGHPVLWLCSYVAIELHFLPYIWWYTSQDKSNWISLSLKPILHNNALLTPFECQVFENIMENGAFALIEQMLHFP